jgi:hypothetical protein
VRRASTRVPTALQFSRAFFAHCTFCLRYEEIYHMSGRAAQDEDAVRRIRRDVEIAVRRQTHQDRIRATKGPGNIAFAPQTIMRVSEQLVHLGAKYHV